MVEITETRKILENMKVEEMLTFPKELENSLRGMARSMYCHGKTLQVKKKRGEDLVTVLRIE